MFLLVSHDHFANNLSDLNLIFVSNLRYVSNVIKKKVLVNVVVNRFYLFVIDMVFDMVFESIDL